MIVSLSPIFLNLLLVGCNNEPEYDLSQIPIQGEPATEAIATAPKPPTMNMPTGEGTMEIGTDECVPPEGATEPLKEENSVTLTMTFDSTVVGHQLIVDIIESEHGELKYGVVCKGTNLSLKVPKLLGKVRVAIFVDADQNGPSPTDKQGISEVMTITDQDINIPSVEWSASPLHFYHFDDKDRQQADPIPDMPAGEDK